MSGPGFQRCLSPFGPDLDIAGRRYFLTSRVLAIQNCRGISAGPKGDQMVRTASRSRPVASFTHAVKVEVYQPKSEVLESTRHLNIEKLKRSARAEIEVGHVATQSCRQLVRARIRKGMVAELVLEPCAEREPIRITPEIARLLKAARQRVARKRRRAPRFPMPVEEFLQDTKAALDETMICVHICIWRYCFDCCVGHRRRCLPVVRAEHAPAQAHRLVPAFTIVRLDESTLTLPALRAGSLPLPLRPPGRSARGRERGRSSAFLTLAPSGRAAGTSSRGWANARTCALRLGGGTAAP
jgi:hypothetical protein